MDDLIEEFIAETNESLEELDLDLVNLEQNPNDKDLLGKIFRLMHTIKGTCGFLGLPRLEKVAHHAENVLGRFRDGDLDVKPEYVTLIFESLDQIKFLTRTIAEKGSEPEGDDSALIEKLDAVYEGRDGDSAAATSANDAEESAEPANDFEAAEETAIEEEFEPVPAPSAAPKAEEAQAAANAAAPVGVQSLRVNVDVLENLMTMVSELVLTRNQLMQILRMQDQSDFTTPLQRLNHVVSELQEGVMKTRMQPIGNAWSKLPRIIRDLSMELSKKIDLKMEGQETELDRQVLDLIKDPLTHMVRNSGDHGIEKPEDRIAAGKSETGTILLKAYHEGGHIIIKITDDGKGLSTEKIKAKVIENGLATEEELKAMSVSQIQQFIFNAGFSTAEQVTAVSGRGVGMDVVRTNIEKIGGHIELTSEEGKGSTFTIKIPLTLAIVSALIVESANERFVIPQLSVRELVMANNDGENKIENIKGSSVFRLRDHLLPLVSLQDLLKFSTPDMEALSQQMQQLQAETDADLQKQSDEIDAPEKAKSANNEPTKNEYIVVIQVGSYSFGIIVDRVFDTEEIVVKPVPKILKDIEIFSGNTILGDGSVIMILDPNGIAKASSEINEAERGSQADTADTEQQAAHRSTSDEKTALLLFRAVNATPKTVPLSLVARLESIDGDKVERANGQFLIQYRDSLMPLLALDDNLQIDPEAKNVPVLVFSDKERNIGLVVEEIIDITEEVIDVKIEGSRPGLLGSAIINDKATDVIDISHFLKSVDQNWFKDHGDEPFSEETISNDDKKRILLVDDSPFFRNMLTPLLSVAGYDVTTLESPLQALEVCEDGAEFDIIISDIEMPEMNGFEFAEKLKANAKMQDTPLLALSSHANSKDIDRGKEAGFNKYIAKFDRDTLLDTISETISEKRQA